MERQELVDLDRLSSNTATETYQPHHGNGRIKEQPLNQGGAVGVISVIRRGPLGVGASFTFTEPVGRNWHHVEGPEPLVQRAAGA